MELALFPLHLVLFPGAVAPLHVFEPRYRAMMQDVLSGDRRFGVVSIRRGMEVGGFAETHDVGCVAVVEQVQRAADGSMALLARGTERFRIERRFPDDPYPYATITVLDEHPGDRPGERLPEARAAVNRYLAVIARMQGTEVVAPALPPDVVPASFVLADALRLDLPERQRLLEAPDAAARLTLVAELAKREALLLERLGPSVGRPSGTVSPN